MRASTPSTSFAQRTNLTLTPDGINTATHCTDKLASFKAKAARSGYSFFVISGPPPLVNLPDEPFSFVEEIPFACLTAHLIAPCSPTK
ncbi:MAG: hypothetical protein JO031_08555 [Ktedonobacteraceae bacterium]|nr:hypothetical protein [Ktedonobacteraceae bacterium]